MAPTKGSKKRYQIKLSSGRVIGPVRLERVRQLIKRKKIVGEELARNYPKGEWQDINSIPDIARLIISDLEGRIDETRIDSSTEVYSPPHLETEVLAETVVLSEEESSQGDELLKGVDGQTVNIEKVGSVSVKSGIHEGSSPKDKDQTAIHETDEKKSKKINKDFKADHDDETIVSSLSSTGSETKIEQDSISGDLIEDPIYSEGDSIQHYENLPNNDLPRPSLADQKTVLFEKSPKLKNRISRIPASLKIVLMGVLIGFLAYDLFLGDEHKENSHEIRLVRPVIPSFLKENADPEKSKKFYQDALKHYLLDHVVGYKNAVRRLLVAVRYDIQNVKALALLASSYINLIDSSNKDERYFSVISKLIEMSRAKDIDLAETVIAESEFYMIVNRSDAAQDRIVNYTKDHKFGNEMFFYLALVFYSRGDYKNASRYVSQIPDDKAFSAKIFYLRGQIAEKIGTLDQALEEYQKALKYNRNHAKSHLKVSILQEKKGELKSAGKHLGFLVRHGDLLSPGDLAQSYYLMGKYFQLANKYDEALGVLEKAIRLNPHQQDYLLELFTLRARLGGTDPKAKVTAKMFYYLRSGEEALASGKYKEALNFFLEARQSKRDSPLPLVKIGDMFVYLNQYQNARDNYKKAVKLAPQNRTAWSKYIKTLIQSYEWEQVKKALAQFSRLPKSKSSIDKLTGDMYAKQGLHREAISFYKQAMKRETIDSEVYSAYARSLFSVKEYRDASFFFALARRFDPLNMEIVLGAARNIAASDSIEQAIRMLRDELQMSQGNRSELLSGIAEFQIQSGEYGRALVTLKEAKRSNAEYAYPWKLEAQIYKIQSETRPKMLNQALLAYQSYSDRNPSDPSGYIERYHIFMKKAQFDKALTELDKIYSLYPRYPNLHYYRGNLYQTMGNFRLAIEEFNKELKNHPQNVQALLVLGQTLIEVGALNPALIQFTKAMQIEPHNSEPRHLAGYANYLLKNYQGAIALYRSAIEFEKGNPLIFKRLGLAYYSIGDKENASQAFRKYLQLAPDAPDRAEFEKFL